MLVWAGWGHLSKAKLPGANTMARHFEDITGIEPVSIDQTATIHGERNGTNEWHLRLKSKLEKLGGTAGFLIEDAPVGWTQRGVNAYLLSLDNQLE